MSDWKDKGWVKTLAKVAPGIATALGTPLAGVAVSMATQALGIDGGDEASLAAAVASGDTETLLKLKQVEKDFLKEMRRLDVDIFKAEVADRSSARTMDNARIAQITLSVIYTGGYFGTMYVLFAGDVQIADNLREMAGALIVGMTAAQAQILRFWFGGLMQPKDMRPGQ